MKSRVCWRVKLMGDWIIASEIDWATISRLSVDFHNNRHFLSARVSSFDGKLLIVQRSVWDVVRLFLLLRICLQYISQWTISCEALPQKKKSRICEEIYRGFSETVPKHCLTGFPHNVSIIIVIAASRPLSQTSIHWLTCVRN